ncbi:MAG: cytidylate kinase-like family protein [Desulfobacteraceae bacterium]|nr:cytidylate kinase-like family protein [Desulfobacteraceae bacterium]
MKTVEKIIEEQVQRWEISRAEKKKEEQIPVITISREPGSGGRALAEKLAEKLGFDLFHREIINEMANSAQVSSRVLETLDEKGLSVLDEWITSLVDDRHLWPDQYLQHLMKVVGAIGKHGKSVIVGRGANFVLPREKSFRVRIVAPHKIRVQNTAKQLSISNEKAEGQIIRTESDRRSFVRKYFNANIADPINYDMLINTEAISTDSAVNTIKSAIGL